MEFTKHKAVISGAGTTLTALATAWAAVEVATADGTLDIGEYGPLATAVATVVATIYAVWRVPNQVIPGPIMKVGTYVPPASTSE